MRRSLYVSSPVSFLPVSSTALSILLTCLLTISLTGCDVVNLISSSISAAFSANDGSAEKNSTSVSDLAQPDATLPSENLQNENLHSDNLSSDKTSKDREEGIKAPKEVRETGAKEAAGQPPGTNNPEESGMDARRSLDALNIREARLRFEIPSDFKPIAAHSGELLLLERAFLYSAGQTKLEAVEGVVSVGRDGLVVAWPKAGRPGRLLLALPEPPDAATFCQDGSLLASADKGAITIRALPDGKETARLDTIKTRVLALAFSPSCDSIVIGGSDGMVYRWKFAAWRADLTYAQREKLLERYIAHPISVGTVAFHPFGRLFFSGDWDGALNAWLRYDSDAFGAEYADSYTSGNFFTTGVQKMRAPRGEGDDVNILLTSTDGQFLFIALQGGGIELWKVRGLKKVCEIPAHKGMIYSAKFTADETGVVTLGRDGHVRSWDITKKPDPAGGPDIFTFVPLKDGLVSANGAESEVRFIVPTGEDEYIGGTLHGKVIPVQTIPFVPTPTPVPTRAPIKPTVGSNGAVKG